MDALRLGQKQTSKMLVWPFPEDGQTWTLLDSCMEAPGREASMWLRLLDTILSTRQGLRVVTTDWALPAGHPLALCFTSGPAHSCR